jgi:hypothetical protein
MIATLLARLGAENAGRLAAVLGALALIAAAAFAAWQAASAIERSLDAMRADIRAERDAHWSGVIATANAKAEAAAAEQARQAAWRDGRAREDISRMAAQLSDLERANHALADSQSCGLDRDRVRLLRQQR